MFNYRITIKENDNNTRIISLTPEQISDIGKMYVARQALSKTLLNHHTSIPDELKIIGQQLYGKNITSVIDDDTLIKKLIKRVKPNTYLQNDIWLNIAKDILKEYANHTYVKQKNNATLILTENNNNNLLQKTDRLNSFREKFEPVDAELKIITIPISSEKILFGISTKQFYQKLKNDKNWNDIVDNWLEQMIISEHKNHFVINTCDGQVHILK